MKKFRFAVLLLLVCMFSIFTFAACGQDDTPPPQNITSPPAAEQEETTYTSVKLTSKNFSDYLVAGVNFESVNIEYMGIDGLGLETYCLSCLGYVSICKTGNYKFEKATAMCGVIFAEWNLHFVSLEVKLDYNGEGRVSFAISKKLHSSSLNLASDDFTVSVFAATGAVQIYK